MKKPEEKDVAMGTIGVGTITDNASEPVESVDNEAVKQPQPLTLSEDDLFYRELRVNELKDDLAIRVMSLPNDTHTGKIKELAAEHLVKRFS